MPKNSFFIIGYGIVLILLIIFLINKVQFIFQPILVAFQTLFFPFLIAGVLFYLFQPLVDLLHAKRVPRVVSILIIYLSVLSIMAGIILVIGPLLQEQLNRLIRNVPGFAENILAQWEGFQANRESLPDYVNESIQLAIEQGQQMLALIGVYLTSLLGRIPGFLILLVIVPFILFYLLKDGKKTPELIVRWLPKGDREDGRAILSDMNKALSSYVLGQVIVSVCVGIMVYIGYLIIGLEYSLVLALVAMFTNLIPFIGPFIGILPALIVAMMDSPMMVLWVIVVVVIAQQIESNLISPQIMGRALDVHPLTIILLLLVASSLGGILGLIIAVPTYAIIKVISKHAYRLYQLKKSVQ
jgi:predicted PurR-regulated permease PerM